MVTLRYDKSSNTYQLTIPQDIIKFMEWEPNMPILVTINEKKEVVLLPIDPLA